MPASKSLYTSRDRARETAERNRHHDYRSEFRRDYARLIHSPAFRRLQGKTQLFPASESEFFRNRLTHSLEVAQIAKTIACKVNAGYAQFGVGKSAIDTDLVEVAALAHDLGHPPFGHIGEYALNRLMAKAGGFEGNAQTLRILARLEKKGGWRDKLQATGDTRTGLGLTYRTLAAVLKYDNEIPREVPKRGDEPEVVKGYYASEASLVRRVKESVLRKPLDPREKLRTIECEIMDLADDIAYSTYDLEDSLKAEFVSPLEMVAAAGDTPLLTSIAKKVAAATGKPFTADDALRTLLDTFIEADLFEPSVKRILTLWRRSASSNVTSRARLTSIIATAGTFDMSDRIAQDGFFRTRLTSGLVNQFVQGIRAKWNNDEPAVSSVWLTKPVREKVEVLKHYTYEKLIMSHRLKMVEHRGTEIVTAIFETLSSEERKGHLLLPEDFRHWYVSAKGNREAQLRVVCDFIAGMTDRYAVEFYSRLKSERPETLFKPY